MNISQAIELHSMQCIRALPPLCWYNSPFWFQQRLRPSLHMHNHPTHPSVSKLSWIDCNWTFCVSEKCCWREWVHWSQLVSGHFSSNASSACCDQPSSLPVGTVSYYFAAENQKWGEEIPSESPPGRVLIWRRFSWSFWGHALLNSLLLQSVSSTCV